MKQQIRELIAIAAAGSLEDEAIDVLAEEVYLAYADPERYLEENDGPAENGASAGLGERVLTDRLPSLFRGARVDDLYEAIVDDFGFDFDLDLQPEDLPDDTLEALEAIDRQLGEIASDGGYVMLDFGEPPPDELQVAVIYRDDAPRFLALCRALDLDAGFTVDVWSARPD